MPADNNPWSGELKAKRQKSQNSNKGIKNSETVCSSNNSKDLPKSDPKTPKNPIQDIGSHNHANTISNSTKNFDNKISQNVQNCNKEKQGTIETQENKVDESTEEMLKSKRKNLRPVAQPFKRSESVTNENHDGDSPVDRLLRQGSLDRSQDPLATKNQTETVNGMQRMNSTHSGVAAEDVGDNFRDKERKRKESEQYLLVNFPADVRKNLKGIILPQDKKEADTKQEETVNTNKVDESVTEADNDDEDEWNEDEWEWEEEEEEEVPKDEEGKAHITISENLVTIDRSKVDWSDDEFEEEDEAPTSIPPPPPPPAPPAPPPPPPGMPPAPDKKMSSVKSEKLEQLKKKPAKRPDWNDLMKEIGQYRAGSRGLLKKTISNDRSKPMLSTHKVKGVFVYESEKHSKDADILKEINQGIKLKHVRCNDRSKPCLKGIKSFKRQQTKEEKLGKGFSFGDDDNIGELEDLDKLKDDLEATKQLLELEVRSKSLLEKDNKRLQQEIERLKGEFANIKAGGGDAPAPPDILNNILTRERKESISKERRESLIEKRKSIAESNISEIIENNHVEEHVPEQVLEEIDELKEEAEEAKKLAEEWEAKYKEMQKQMEMLDGAGGMYGKKTSTADRPGLQRMQSTASDGVEDVPNNRQSMVGDDNDEDWMQKREVSQLQLRLRNMKDKKEIIVRERKFLNERIDNLKDCIAKEFEARKTLKKDIREMNAAFKEEMADMDHNDQIKKDLEDCWYDESELVDNPYAKKEEEEEEMDEDDEEFAAMLDKDDDMEEDINEILQSADECEELEEDVGAELFDKFATNEESDIEDEEPEASDHPKMCEFLNKRIDHQQEHVKLMRQSNFGLKSKIDILYDILQTQKEKHYDLKQELNRMLSDV